MIEIVFDVLAGFFPAGAVRGDRIVEAYTKAHKAASGSVDSSREPQALIDAMKQTGVPGIYMAPLNSRIVFALDAWARGEEPRDFKRQLRLHDRAER